MKKLILIATLILSYLSINAQKLEADINFWRSKFYKENKTINPQEFKEAIEIDLATSVAYRGFRQNRWWGNFFTVSFVANGAGVILLDDPDRRSGAILGVAISGGLAYWLKWRANKRIDNTFELYNKKKGYISVNPTGIYFYF